MIKARSLQIFISVIIILGLSVVYFYLKEAWSQLNRLSLLEKKLYLAYQDKHRLITSQQSTRQYYHWISLNNPDVLQNIVHTIETSGFIVQSLQPYPIQKRMGVKILPIKMVLVGEFYQLAALMSALRFHQFSVGIRDFSLDIRQHHAVKIEVTMLMLGAKLLALNNSFVSIEGVKWVGYVRNNNDCIALIKLPDGEIKYVHVGDHIISEAARVTSITEDEVIIQIGQRETHLRLVD